MNRPLLAVGVVACIAASGCAGRAGDDHLVVFAASSLAAPLEELAALHEFRGGTPVRLHLGASGALVQQLRAGAPADVFIAADAVAFAQAVDGHLIDASTRHVLASNRVVLARAADTDGPADASLADAWGAGWRIGIADPGTAPVGRAAKAWLDADGQWTQWSSSGRLVYAGTAQAVGAQVSRGAVEAGIVFLTDAKALRLHVLARAPEARVPASEYAGGIVSTSRRRENAALFLDLLTAAEGRKVLADAGFELPAELGVTQPSRILGRQ